MKIISGGKKDYYDYLAGIYGIDEDIVYDRRNGEVFLDQHNRDTLLRRYFGTSTLYTDTERKLEKRYVNNKLVDCLVGQTFRFCLEIGFYQYVFDVSRYIENGKLILEPKLVERVDKGIHISNSPICLYKESPYPGCSPYLIRTFRTNGIESFKNDLINVKNKGYTHENFILAGTWLTSFISAEEVYNNVYDYLIAIREKPIEDNRNDIQKLESKVFDKKTSFRNPSNVRK